MHRQFRIVQIKKSGKFVVQMRGLRRRKCWGKIKSFNNIENARTFLAEMETAYFNFYDKLCTYRVVV